MRISALLLVFALSAAAADQTEKTEVVAAVNRLFQAMASNDGPAIAATMTPDVRLIAAAQDGKVSPARTREEFVQRFAGNKAHMVERMWKPTVLVRGSIATVWAEYDFHVDGKFNHCGIDDFLLVKTAEGWKISSVAYTSQSTNCKPSPLGPPR